MQSADTSDSLTEWSCAVGLGDDARADQRMASNLSTRSANLLGSEIGREQVRPVQMNAAATLPGTYALTITATPSSGAPSSITVPVNVV